MATRLTIGRKAVAIAIIGDLLDMAAERATKKAGGKPTTHDVATAVVELAWDAEYKPHSDRLVLTLDSSFEAPGEDAMRTMEEDYGPGNPPAEDA